MLKVKKLMVVGAISLSLSSLVGCGDIKILKEKTVDYVVPVDAKNMDLDWFYIKDGTKFEPVYMPNGNASNIVNTLDQSRVVYLINDENMVPVHYKNEQIVYCSADTSLLRTGITLERYKDMGYSIGIYGGKIEEDGYYHCQISKNVCPGTDAAKILSAATVDDMRIISIGGIPVHEVVDAESGILHGFEKDKVYTMEFYLGSFYYTAAFTADTHMFRAFEYKYFDGSNVQDTKLRYMAFDTPDDMRSGYYMVNGEGIFKYYDYLKGNVPDEVDFNEVYFSSEREQILQYTRLYNLSVPVDTRDMKITLGYNSEPEEKNPSRSDFISIDENDIGGYLISPDGKMYDMKVDHTKNTISISLQYAMAGDWTVNIYPRDLRITSLDTVSAEAAEETACEQTEIEITADETYQAFYADIRGEKDSDVFGYIIAEDGRTYQFSIGKYKDHVKNDQRYLIYQFPHLSAGKYVVKIYHYASKTTISDVKQYSYDPVTNEIVYLVDASE